MTLGDQFEPRGGLELLAWALEPNLCARQRDAKEAAAWLGGYFKEDPRKAIRLCLGTDKARPSETRNFLKERLRAARRQRAIEAGTESQIRATGLLSRQRVLTELPGVCRDLLDEAERTALQIVDALRAEMFAEGVVVVGTSPSGVRRPLERIELKEARLDVPKNTIKVGDLIWRHVEVKLPDKQDRFGGGLQRPNNPMGAPEPPATEGPAPEPVSPPTKKPSMRQRPLAKGEIPDSAHIAKMLKARRRYKSWSAVITGKIELSKVQGQSDEAKRKRLVKKASAADREQRPLV